MEKLHPGVYIQEISSGVRPIEGVSTSNAAFIGKAQMGSLNKAVLVTSPQEFQSAYGVFLPDSFLARAVFQFFNNGGRKCYVVRVPGAGAVTASISIKDRKQTSTRTLTIRAANEGAWGNRLDIVIANGTGDPGNEFAIQVFQNRDDQVPPLPPLLLEIFDNLSMDQNAANYVKNVIAASSRYIAVDVNTTNFASAPAGFSRGGKLPFVGNATIALKLGVGQGGTETAGTVATAGASVSAAAPSTNPPADQRTFNINLNGDGARLVTIPPEAATGIDIAAAIQSAVRAMVAITAANQPAYNGFTSDFTANLYTLKSGTLGTSSTVVVTNSASPTVSLPGPANQFQITLNNDGPHLVSLPVPLADGTTIADAIQTAVRAISPTRAANLTAFTGFLSTYDTSSKVGNPSFLLTSGTAGVGSSVNVSNGPTVAADVASFLKLGSTNTGSEIKGGAVLRPANSKIPTEYHVGSSQVAGNVDGVTFGADGSLPQDQDHINGLAALDVVRDVNIVCIPGHGSADVVAAGANYCARRGDCFFIGDLNSTDDTVPEAQAFINGLTVKNSYAAVYYPWLKMADPTGAAQTPIQAPPSGFVAGMYARIDAKRGVWKAPAGTEANVAGALGLQADTTDSQQDFLNPIGVNVIRSFPATGLVIWGTRTLATRSDPEYRYVPVRRTAIYLEQSIYNGIQWAVFEPNDEDLWASLRLNIGAFMLLQFQAGAFQGKTPADAFFVKCDNTTTTQADIDAGVVNILVGFAPLKPAEFVVLQLTQKAGQPSV
jgi:uncharacterized protein